MRPLQALRHSLTHSATPTRHVAHPQSITPSAPASPDNMSSRHDAQLFTGRTVPVDPYKVWLEQREAERERERHSLNPHHAWENLRTQSFCAIGRG
jgi:hypothetical protein